MQKGIWTDDIHTFEYEDREILYQVNTGTFFEIDTLVKDILSCSKTLSSKAEIAGELLPHYDLDQILETIEGLEAYGILSFGPPSPFEDVPEGAPPGSSAPLDITLHVSHGCNIKCTYCFAEGGSYGGKPTMMDFATAKQAVDWLLQGSAISRKCNVTFFGGEPLLNLDLIVQVVRYARGEAGRLGIDISFGMTTNGTLLSGEALEFIMQEDIGILVSLDGDASTHNRNRTFHDDSDTYGTIAENVRNMAAQKPDQIKLRATMTAHNLDIEGIADHLSQLGASTVSVAPVVGSRYTDTAIRAEHLPELKGHLKKLCWTELNGLMQGDDRRHSYFGDKIRQLLNPRKKDYGCGGGKTFLGVSVDGSIYFCSALAGLPEFKMGDVFNGIDPEKKQRFDRDLYVDSREPCNTCWARYLCGGGCIYDAQMVNGTPLSPNPVACDQIRYSYELAMGMCVHLQEERPEAFEALCDDAD